jgi:hypothetical protein
MAVTRRKPGGLFYTFPFYGEGEIMATMYEITRDMDALQRLVEEAVDEETGEIAGLTEEDEATFKEWINETEAAFDRKFDNICRFNRNLKHEAELAEAERAGFKAEMDRLSRRAKSAQNKADRVKFLLHLAFDYLHITKHKTAYFSAGVQNTAHSVKTDAGFDPSLIPDKYLKKELNITAVKEAVKSGELYTKEDSPLDRGKLFIAGRENEALPGVSYLQGQTLVIR